MTPDEDDEEASLCTRNTAPSVLIAYSIALVVAIISSIIFKEPAFLSFVLMTAPMPLMALYALYQYRQEDQWNARIQRALDKVQQERENAPRTIEPPPVAMIDVAANDRSPPSTPPPIQFVVTIPTPEPPATPTGLSLIHI